MTPPRVELVFCKNLAQLGMLLLFPGFLFYHFIGGYFAIRLPIAGFFGPVSSAIALAGIILLSIGIFKNRKITVYGFLVFMFFGYTVAYISINFALLDSGYGPLAVRESVESWVLWLGVFFAGSWLPRNIELTKKVCWLSLLATTLFLAQHLYSTDSLMYYARELYGNDHIATYQGFGRSVFVIALFLFAVAASWLTGSFVFICSFFALFMLGSRSEFVAFLISCLAILALSNVAHGKRSLFLVIAVISMIVVFLRTDVSFMENSRHYQLLDIGQASSWLSRQEFQSTAIRQIIENPFLGSFGGHIDFYGATGSYAHNFLSAWVNYGFFGVLLYLCLTLVPLIHSIRIFSTRNCVNGDWKIVMLFSLASFVFVLSAKSVFSVIPPLSWGLYARALNLSRGYPQTSFGVTVR